MSEKARELFNQLSPRIQALDTQVLELAEKRSISYHGPNFFAEILPRKHRLLVLLPLEFNEVEDPSDLVVDATERKFFVHAKYEGGVAVRTRNAEDVELAIPLIRDALNLEEA